MVFSCAPNFRAKAAAKKQALKQKLAGAGAYHGVSLRLLLVDKQVDAQDVLPHAALGCVHVVKYDAHSTTLAELVALIREAHRQNGAPFLSMAIAQHGADSEGQWEWTTDLTVNLKSVHGAIDQLAPIVEVLAAALSKTKAGKAHIDLLACNLATTCKGLVPALEKMYGIDFRASTDETGNDLSGGDWKMETDNDYDVAADYLDAAKLKAYAETMALKGTPPTPSAANLARRRAAASRYAAVDLSDLHAATKRVNDKAFAGSGGPDSPPGQKEFFLQKANAYCKMMAGMKPATFQCVVQKEGWTGADAVVPTLTSRVDALEGLMEMLASSDNPKWVDDAYSMIDQSFKTCTRRYERCIGDTFEPLVIPRDHGVITDKAMVDVANARKRLALAKSGADGDLLNLISLYMSSVY